MDEQSFLELCIEKNYDQNAIDKFKAAISLAKDVLLEKIRICGDSFFEHNLRVATILAENHSTPEVVVGGLLHGFHDALKEHLIREQFGEEIYLLTQGEEEIKRIKEKNQQMEADALRRIILTTLRDVRVIVVKLANKLDNLRSIEVLPKDDQTRISQEVLEIYAPLAYRLGMEKIKNELEDIALKNLHPGKYKEIENFLKESSQERKKSIIEAINIIAKLAAPQLEIIKIKGRPKHIYSIYKKITQRKVRLGEQYDLLGIRITVNDVKDCYTLLGLLHQNFEPIEGRLKDYIANPKPNFYRSIHTALRFPGDKIVEVQIRTPEMDEFAEEGIAAHWRYKGVKSEEMFEKKIAWLKNVLDMQKSSETQEFLDTVKVDLFGDEIYCYTPKGDVKQLPLGATVLDFAYTIHEEVGSHTVGARVNGKFVALKHELVLGDVVEILTNKHQRPRRTWIKLVKSARAKQKIRRSLKEHEKLPALHYHLLKPVVMEEQGILIESEEFPKATCVLAKCCHPLPGQPLAGIITKRRIISVHSQECRHAEKEKTRWVSVTWRNTFSQKIRFFVLANERSGLLADLLHTIANAGFEVKEAKAKLIDVEHALCSFLVVPRDLEHLKELIKRVGKVRAITRVYFE
jgi:GTP diphosphokinase / guanosine-3',5'-bis(diphosphate) 3'-diphosphatase